ncbi:MAG: magnesium transporter [Rhizobiales bacterium]|nr:magnesium transporter [Hyphomicrobiales bacterium]
MDEATPPASDSVRPATEESPVTSRFVARIGDLLEAGDLDRLRAAVEELHAADLADLVEHLEPDQRVRLFSTLGEHLDFDVYAELDETVRDQIVEDLPNDQLAAAVRELDSDDAVYLLDGLDADDQSDVLAQVPESDRAQIERSLQYPEESAGRLMQTEFIAVPPYWTVGHTIDHMRDTEDLPETFTEIYVVDPTFHLLGTVRLDRLLRTKRPVRIQELMDDDVSSLEVGLDQEQVARQFERYDLYSAPVVDENGRLIGVVTADDVMEVIQSEAEEDIKALGGVGDESISDTVIRIARGRFAWLLVNLATAVLASLVIGLFDATIEQMVALAVLMPIVASMGGNAATQTMTVAVRALATKELSVVNARRIVWREAVVGLLNGLLFAAIMAGVAIVWFGSNQLGLVIAAAMLVNMLVAGIAGILIPMALERLGADPAIASSVFVTTVTDVIGFFAFLGLATLVLV